MASPAVCLDCGCNGGPALKCHGEAVMGTQLYGKSQVRLIAAKSAGLSFGGTPSTDHSIKSNLIRRQ